MYNWYFKSTRVAHRRREKAFMTVSKGEIAVFRTLKWQHFLGASPPKSPKYVIRKILILYNTRNKHIRSNKKLQYVTATRCQNKNTRRQDREAPPPGGASDSCTLTFWKDCWFFENGWEKQSQDHRLILNWVIFFLKSKIDIGLILGR